jgi:flagellar basal body-associated protein FliL
MSDEGAPAEKRSLLKGRVPMTLALVVGIAVVEGIGFYAATKLLGGGPQAAYGEEGQDHVLDGEDSGLLPSSAEIELLSKFKVPNDKRGRLYIYDFDITLKVPGQREAEVAQLVTERKGEISDRVARLVRAADPALLHEPELKTLRMQIQHAVGEIADDQDIVIEVLIPRCVPLRSD